MYDYVCKDDLGNETIVVTFSEKQAWKQAGKRFKKKYKSKIVSVTPDYSKIY